MKKMLCLLVFMLLLAGCQPKVEPVVDEPQVDIEKNEENTDETSETEEEKSPAIQDEKAVLEALNTLAEENVDPSEINAFLTKHVSNLGIESANYALITYFNQILDYGGHVDGEILSPAYQKLASEVFRGGFSIEKLDTVDDQGFVDTVNTLYANGLKLEMVNGYYVASIDFGRLLRGYGNEIGEDIKAYIELVQMTFKAHIQVNTQDDMNAVAKLIVDHDKYLKAYPNSMVIEDVRLKRDWLRDVYFIEGTYINNYRASGQVNPLDSFNDVVEFYPGTELERMTQGFMSVWSRVGKRPSRVLEAYVKFYDRGIIGNAFLLSEGETADGFLYPRFEGLEAGKFIEADLENLLKAFKTRYISEDMDGWQVIQSYEITALNENRISIVLYFDLTHSMYPNLSVRDVAGRTYDLKSGQALNLGDILPTEEESLTHLLADVKQFSGKNKYNASQVDERWKAVYETEEGIVIYTPGIQTRHNVNALLIPYSEIAKWID